MESRRALNPEDFLQVLREEDYTSKTHLNLSNRKLATLTSTESEREHKAEEIDIRSNFLIHIEPRAFACFPCLRNLYLGANELTNIPDFDGLVELIELHLSSNKIIKIDHLESLKNLQVLDLRSNRITHVENLDHNRQLRRLSLSANLIGQEGLEISRFPYLECLEFLGLFGNFLTNFESIVSLLKMKTPHLKEIYIAANPCTMISTGPSSSQGSPIQEEFPPGATGIETMDSCKSQLIQALPDLIRIDGVLITRKKDHSSPPNE